MEEMLNTDARPPGHNPAFGSPSPVLKLPWFFVRKRGDAIGFTP